MTNPTPDPLALAEEAERELLEPDWTEVYAQLEQAALGVDRGPELDAQRQFVYRHCARELALAAALRAAHEENQRLREELHNTLLCYRDLLHSDYCGRHGCDPRCSEASMALAGGKGEG